MFSHITMITFKTSQLRLGYTITKVKENR